ncbi:unnamed protein product [Polarella glacialis]|uniref:Uncharacterized protein n=1 Tax=Polarella glacialis TaxID=89957 RepID=A0A813H3T5_POLGL|nr:unnamed protein product [Polarella glacialis]CAE8724662.1 unnamed protein product [Polarella glacialis]
MTSAAQCRADAGATRQQQHQHARSRIHHDDLDDSVSTVAVSGGPRNIRKVCDLTQQDMPEEGDFDWDSCCDEGDAGGDLMDVDLPGPSAYVPDDVVTGRVPHAPSGPKPLGGRAARRQMIHGRSAGGFHASSESSTRASSMSSCSLPSICENTSCWEEDAQYIRAASVPAPAHGTGFRAARMLAL